MLSLLPRARRPSGQPGLRPRSATDLMRPPPARMRPSGRRAVLNPTVLIRATEGAVR